MRRSLAALALFSLVLWPLFTGAIGAQADSGILPSVAPNQAGQMAITRTWAFGQWSANKVSPEHPNPAMLTLSWLVPYEGQFPQYSSSTIIFWNGSRQTRSDLWIWEVGRETPSLYLVLASTSRVRLMVLVIDTYNLTVKEGLHVATATDATMQCGVVFTVGGQHYTVRGTPQKVGEVHTDLTHALIRGTDTCR